MHTLVLEVELYFQQCSKAINLYSIVLDIVPCWKDELDNNFLVSGTQRSSIKLSEGTCVYICPYLVAFRFRLNELIYKDILNSYCFNVGVTLTPMCVSTVYSVLFQVT